MVNNLDKMMSAKDAELIQNEIAYQTQHPAKDGITWIATTNDKTKMPEWLFDKNRTGISMPVGRIQSDAEASAVLSHFITSTERKDKLNHDEILDYLEHKKFPMVPGKIKEMIDRVDTNLERTKDQPYWETHWGQDFKTLGYKEPVRNEYLKEYIEGLTQEGKDGGAF